ncbi:hypothetical protein [Pseudarthrobacter siccitolerans]|uniref:hypothetical protein n=1 Tax=Pseudarthrobacter siccitolerans TaxID=861266 RepID=UPI0006789829|nr:hypothetical protein [Pseudarthrobacter siccitolerans]
MSQSHYVVNVDSELKFTVVVTESDGVHLQLSSGAYDAVLEPGDRFELILRPAKMDEDPSTPMILEEKLEANRGFRWPTLGDRGPDDPLVEYIRKAKDRNDEV